MTQNISVPPDFVGEYENAFRRGQSLGRPSRAPASGPPAQARRRVEIYATLGAGLLGRPYEERRAILAHLAPALVKEGLSPAAVNHFDPTDDAIVRSMQSARDAGASL